VGQGTAAGTAQVQVESVKRTSSEV
jgi:hypothetical protein